MKGDFLPRWPKRPPLLPEVFQELELHGPDSMRALLASSTDGYSGTGRDTPIRFGNVVTKRGEIQDWLKWKAQVDTLWIKAGVVAAVLAAIFSFLGLLR
jgi:hypothetical protein